MKAYNNIYWIKGVVAAFVIVVTVCLMALVGAFIPYLTDSCAHMLKVFTPIVDFIIGAYVLGTTFKKGAEVIGLNQKGKK